MFYWLAASIALFAHYISGAPVLCFRVLCIIISELGTAILHVFCNARILHVTQNLDFWLGKWSCKIYALLFSDKMVIVHALMILSNYERQECQKLNTFHAMFIVLGMSPSPPGTPPPQELPAGMKARPDIPILDSAYWLSKYNPLCILCSSSHKLMVVPDLQEVHLATSRSSVFSILPSFWWTILPAKVQALQYFLRLQTAGKPVLFREAFFWSYSVGLPEVYKPIHFSIFYYLWKARVWFYCLIYYAIVLLL